MMDAKTTTVRRLFFEDPAASTKTTMPLDSDTAREKKNSRFSISDIIKTETSSQKEDGFNSTNSAKDIAVDAEVGDRGSGTNTCELNNTTYTFTGVYPGYSTHQPSTFGTAPPPVSHFYPSYPMFIHSMFQSAYPTQAFHYHMPHQQFHFQQQNVKGDHTTEEERASPASSNSSSGVSSDPESSPVHLPPTVSHKHHSEHHTMKTRAPVGRTCYSRVQVQGMEKVFSETRYPDYDELERLSSELGIPVKRIKVWFQNRRARSKTVFPDRSSHMTAMMSSVANGYMTASPMMPLPFPVPAPNIMPVYPVYPIQ